MTEPSKELKRSKELFKSNLCSMIDTFIANNSVVEIGDRVFHSGQEFEVINIELSMSKTGSLEDFLPILNYYGKPVSKRGAVISNRKNVLLLNFVKLDGAEYVREHVCFEPKDICRYMYN